MSKDNVFVIGIAGGTGSGKSSVVNVIKNQFKDDICVICYDNYYKAHHDMPLEERNKLNYDCPDAFDTDLLYDHLKKLIDGQEIECPVYDFTIHDRSDETIRVSPNKILIVEGIFALYDDRIRDLYDTMIYVAVDRDERILRRLKRDVEKRGRSIDSVMTQYLTTVKPMHEKYVAPTKNYASIVVPAGASNRVAMNMIIAHIRHYTNMWDPSKAYGLEPLEDCAVFD